MKKLALALVCLMGVAFFTSCDKDPVVENPEPSIVVLAQEGYLADGDVIDVNVEYPYGFRAASNPDTQKELYKLVVTCTVDEVTTYLCDSLISGTEFTFEGSISFETREIIGEAEIIATVTDNDGKTNTASFKISVNKEDNLVAYGFTWNRHGGQPATGLEPFGLKWEKNAEKDIYAVIEPLEGAQLYCFENAKVWDETQTEAQLAALFSEATTATQFKEVSCTAGDKDYNLVIGTTYNGYNYLINVTHSHAESFKGTDVTITGEFK
jgi:hypothetical protein